MDLHDYRPSSVEAGLEDLSTQQAEVDADELVFWLKEYFDAHLEIPGVIVTDGGRFMSVLSRDALYRRLSRAFGREIFLRRSIREFLEVWPQEAMRVNSTCTIHHTVELALGRPAPSTYEPVLVEYSDGRLGLLEMHALLVAQSHVLSLARLIEEQRQAAESANRAKSEFLANISHELRTPLHGIASYARFGKDEAQSGDRGELQDYFCAVEKCSDTLLRLVNDLLDLSKLEAGKMQLEFQPACLDDLVLTIVDEFNSICDERNVTILYLPLSKDSTALLDPERIKQVLRNLLSNAVKFSPQNSRVLVRLHIVGRSALLSVCDNGPGIPENELETIFDKFVQSSKTKSGSGGTGLGLAITREIVTGHRGRVWAENNVDGPGATFYCEFPLNQVAEASVEPDDMAVAATT
jgi:signal transduction histidine kinase